MLNVRIQIFYGEGGQVGGQHEDPLGQSEHLSPHDLHKASTPHGRRTRLY